MLLYVLFLAYVNQNWKPELQHDGAASHAPFFFPLFLCAAFHIYDDVPQSCEHLAPPRHTNVFDDTINFKDTKVFNIFQETHQFYKDIIPYYK